MYYTNILYELHIVEDKIHYFEAKYNVNFEQFEKDIINSKENFEKWDDYMEWKAFRKKHEDLTSQKKDLENGNYKVS